MLLLDRCVVSGHSARLIQQLTSLTDLSLPHINELPDGFFEPLTSLTSLSLTGFNSKEAMNQVQCAMPVAPRLRALKLSLIGCFMEGEQVCALLNAATSLRSLSLTANCAAMLRRTPHDSLSRLTQLRHLGLMLSKVCDELQGGSSFAYLCDHCPNVSSVVITDPFSVSWDRAVVENLPSAVQSFEVNGVVSFDLEELRHVLRRYPSICSVQLQRTLVSAEQARAVLSDRSEHLGVRIDDALRGSVTELSPEPLALRACDMLGHKAGDVINLKGVTVNVVATVDPAPDGQSNKELTGYFRNYDAEADLRQAMSAASGSTSQQQQQSFDFSAAVDTFLSNCSVQTDDAAATSALAAAAAATHVFDNSAARNAPAKVTSGAIARVCECVGLRMLLL